jgi:hypothetical protein
VVNGGDYTVTQVMLRFGIGDRLDEPVRTEHVPAPGTSAVATDTQALGYSDVLTPGTGLRATASDVEHAVALKAIPIVRWTYRWGRGAGDLGHDMLPAARADRAVPTRFCRACCAGLGPGFSRLVPGWGWCMVDLVVNGAGVARVVSVRCHPQRCARRLNDVAILHFRRVHLTTDTTWPGGVAARAAAGQEDVRWSSERVRAVRAGRRA